MKRPLANIIAVVLLLTAILPSTVLPAVADADMDGVIVWDMERLPDNLYEADWAWDQEGQSGGLAKAYITLSKADGAGVDGSAAVCVQYKAKAKSHMGDCGFHLRINKDAGAINDWFGAKSFSIWMDASSTTKDFTLELMLDGVQPKIGAQYSLRSESGTKNETTVATWGGAEYGALTIPAGFKGYIRIDASAYETMFGVVQSISVKIGLNEERASYPISIFFDDMTVAFDETIPVGHLRSDGELYNQGIDRNAQVLYTNLTKRYQTVRTFGASSAWWTSSGGLYPSIDNVLKTLFTDDGAGLNTYRFEIGASVKSDYSDTFFPKSKKAVLSPLTEDGSLSAERDEGSYQALMKALALGTIDDFTLFVNSPPSTMTKNGKTSGSSENGKTTNLKSECFADFADYCVDVVEYYIGLGVPVRYISPVNEPQYDWCESSGQEGCHYTPEEVISIAHSLAEKLDERSKTNPALADVKLLLSESGTWYDSNYTNVIIGKILLDKTLLNRVDCFGAHSYAGNESNKSAFAREMRNIGNPLPLVQTEYAPGHGEPDFSVYTAMDVARVLDEDFSILNAEAWSFWLACSDGTYSDALAYITGSSEDVMTTKRLWVIGNYAKFIKNAFRVAVDTYGLPEDVRATAYVKPENDTLVYVLTNYSSEEKVFSFMGFEDGTVGEAWETSPVRNLEKRGTVSVDYGVPLAPCSVTTFVFHDIDYERFTNGVHPLNRASTLPQQNYDYAGYHSEDYSAPVVPAAAQASEPVVENLPNTEVAQEETITLSKESQNKTMLPYLWIGGGIATAAVTTAAVLYRRNT